MFGARIDVDRGRARIGGAIAATKHKQLVQNTHTRHTKDHASPRKQHGRDHAAAGSTWRDGAAFGTQCGIAAIGTVIQVIARPPDVGVSGTPPFASITDQLRQERHRA